MNRRPCVNAGSKPMHVCKRKRRTSKLEFSFFDYYRLRHAIGPRLNVYRLADFVNGRYLASADLLAAEPEDAPLFGGGCDSFGDD